jgi:hypothetical protein
MDLNGLACGYTRAVTPPTAAQVLASTGYTTNAAGERTPSYAAAVDIFIDVQALQYNDIVQLDGMQIQGERRAVYIHGDWNGIVRADLKGGDLLKFPAAAGGPQRTWKVAFVFENWPDWTKLAVTLQDDQHA